jgi:quinoprotein glucose dehydrogenase
MAAVALATGRPSAQQPQAPPAGEWRSYAGDLRNHHYSPLDQINAGNFSSLDAAWRFKTDSLGPRPEYKLEGTPLAIGGMLYTTAGTRRAVVALDGATGELRWLHSEIEGARAGNSPRQLSGRGVAYWTDGPRRRADSLRHDWLSAGRARRQDRVAHRRLRQRRHRRSEGRRRRRQG